MPAPKDTKVSAIETREMLVAAFSTVMDMKNAAPLEADPIDTNEPRWKAFVARIDDAIDALKEFKDYCQKKG